MIASSRYGYSEDNCETKWDCPRLSEELIYQTKIANFADDIAPAAQ